jgi:hypothetical protein
LTKVLEQQIILPNSKKYHKKDKNYSYFLKETKIFFQVPESIEEGPDADQLTTVLEQQIILLKL